MQPQTVGVSSLDERCGIVIAYTPVGALPLVNRAAPNIPTRPRASPSRRCWWEFNDGDDFYGGDVTVAARLEVGARLVASSSRRYPRSGRRLAMFGGLTNIAGKG